MKPQVYIDPRPAEYFDKFYERPRTEPPDWMRGPSAVSGKSSNRSCLGLEPIDVIRQRFRTPA